MELRRLPLGPSCRRGIKLAATVTASLGVADTKASVGPLIQAGAPATTPTQEAKAFDCKSSRPAVEPGRPLEVSRWEKSRASSLDGKPHFQYT